MYNDMGSQPGMPRLRANGHPDPFRNTFSEAGFGLVRNGLGAYGQRILGNSEYVQSNGHWTRVSDPVGGRLSYRPLMYDINAPDLYIPFISFGTYAFLGSLLLGIHGKFDPEALNLLFVKGLLGWSLQVSFVKVSLFSLGSGEVPLLDIVAYAGYTFIGLSLAAFSRLPCSYSYYFLVPLTCLSIGIFLVKTMKRVRLAEVRSYDSTTHSYVLLFTALAQFPLFIWLGNVSNHWLL